MEEWGQVGGVDADTLASGKKTKPVATGPCTIATETLTRENGI